MSPILAKQNQGIFLLLLVFCFCFFCFVFVLFFSVFVFDFCFFFIFEQVDRWGLKTNMNEINWSDDFYSEMSCKIVSMF